MQPLHFLCVRKCTLRPNRVSNSLLQYLQQNVFSTQFPTVSCSIEFEIFAVVQFFSPLLLTMFFCFFRVDLPFRLLKCLALTACSIRSCLVSCSNCVTSFLNGGCPWLSTDELSCVASCSLKIQG